MTNREKIEQLRGEFVRKTVFVLDDKIHLDILGYENYPAPMYWDVVVHGESASGWSDQEFAVSNALSMNFITNEQALVLEDAVADISGAIFNKLSTVW